MCSLEIFVTVKFNNIEIKKKYITEYVCRQYVTSNIIIALILKYDIHELSASLNLLQKLRAYFDKK